MEAEMSRSRRTLPGQTCPECQRRAKVVHLRYNDSNEKPLDTPIRTFECECGNRYVAEALDVKPSLVLRPPLSPHAK
jgi:DNA-directed RNA polymerase subunit M/transcription elongation factor TFIIS